MVGDYRGKEHEQHAGVGISVFLLLRAAPAPVSLPAVKIASYAPEKSVISSTTHLSPKPKQSGS